MKSTMDLFEKALSIKKAAAWANDLNLSRAAFSMAKRQRRLSPMMAGNLAMKLGENPIQWIAIAAIEAEPESSNKRTLMDCVTSL